MILKLVGPLVILAAAACAGEYAVLSTGFRIHADRHEIDGKWVRLYVKDGITQLPASAVVSFEADETISSPPVALTPPGTTAARTPQQIVDAAAKKNGLPAALVHSVVSAESAYRPDALSPKGAVGLMQLMPGTARDLKVNPRDPAQNVEGGTAYLRELLLKYQGDNDQVRRALAAYNAGPNAVERYNGTPPYPETKNYVERVLWKYDRLKQSTQMSGSR